MIRIFFNYENQTIQLPVNPSEIAINTSSNIKSMEMVELGEISILKGQKLKEFKFGSFLPNEDKYPFILTKGDFREPQFYIDFFSKIIEDRKPCRFIVTDTNVNMLVSIVSFNHKRIAGDDDTIFDISLKEYRESRTRVLHAFNEDNYTEGIQTPSERLIVQNTAHNSPNNRHIERTIPKTYTVKSGDNLWQIAKSVLGNGDRYKEIYELNKDKIKNPSLIYAGTVLKMPN